LFQAFSSTKLKGNGLGLILSKQIVDAHKGKIYILEEEQKGFAIKLPIQ
jgi:two-component system sensor histidine kinase AtoS